MKNRTLISLDCIIMMEHGIIMLLLGPLIPEIMRSFNIGEGTAGLLLSAGSLGFTIGPLLAGVSIDKAGVKTALAGGLIAEVVFLIIFGFTPFFWLAAAVNFFLVFASSYVETAINVIPSLLRHERPGSVMNLVHFFFSIGAFISPILIGLYISSGGRWQRVMWAAAVPAGILGIMLLFITFSHSQQNLIDENPQILKTRQVIGSRTVVFGALTLLLYVGAEIGLSSWVVYYLEKHLRFSKFSSSFGLSLLWIGIMAGRFGNTFLARRFSSLFLITVSSGLGVAAGILFLFAASVPSAYILLFFIGIAMAGTYPNTMAEINRRYPGKIGAVTGVMTFGAGAGAMLFQWIMGVTAEQAGLTAAILIPPVLLALSGVSFLIAVKPAILSRSKSRGRSDYVP